MMSGQCLFFIMSQAADRESVTLLYLLVNCVASDKTGNPLKN